MADSPLMRLFETYDRNDTQYGRHDEPIYEHLNRSACPEYLKVRALLQNWFAAYPVKDAVDLRTRFRSHNDGEHSSAFFELFLHQFLQQLKCGVDVHPVLPGRAKTPDFRVREPVSNEFYVEARIVNDQLSDGFGVEQRRNRVLAIIDAIPSNDFRLSVDEENIPKTDPPRRLIETSIQKWLKTLNWEVERNRMKAGFSDYPEAPFDFSGYKLTIQAIARPAEQHSNTHSRAIGVTAMGCGRFIQPGNGLRKAIKEKASKYGDLHAPFVIGLNIIDSCVWNDDDVEDALFGDDQVVDVRHPDGRWRSEVRRVPNGVFIRGGHVQHTRVSAILAFRHLFPWSLSAARVRVFHNPWAKYPYSGVLDALPAARDVNGVYQRTEGRSVSQFLDPDA